MNIPYEMIVKLIIGTLLGGIIGFERQSHGRPAGVRTHLLVCLAAVIIMIISNEYYQYSRLDPDIIRIDPARIAAGAIIGVGFLGAGVIIKSGLTIQGLTTAASIWIVSAIGLAVGSSLYSVAIIGSVITFFALWILRKAETKISRLRYKLLLISTENPDFQPAINETLRDTGIYIENIDYEMNRINNEFTYHVSISYRDTHTINKINKAFLDMPEIKRFYLRG